jgi:diacylglycerol kinase (ATP)
MTRHKIIINPIAGRGAGERAVPLVEQTLQSHNLEFDLVRTERPWHAAELAQQACAGGYDVVVAVGGDGTANEVLNGIMLARQSGKPTALGVLCVGRGNDFAFGVGAPGGIEDGCRALAQGHRRKIDVGRVVGGRYPQGRYFGNGVGIGFDAVVGFVAAKTRWLTGSASYVVAALETIFLYYRAPLLRIECDGQTLALPALMVSIMNGRRMGGGFMMGPEARPDDGLFDVCIARQVSRARIFTLIPRFMRGTQATHPSIKTMRAQRVVVTAIQGVLPAHGDGETLCTEGQQLTMEVWPRQMDIISKPEGQ